MSGPIHEVTKTDSQNNMPRRNAHSRDMEVTPVVNGLSVLGKQYVTIAAGSDIFSFALP
jgi:hypothetical protein